MACVWIVIGRSKALIDVICDIAYIANMADQVENLPATLRAVRTALQLTQQQLGEKLGVSFATVNRWEGGEVKPQKAAREAIIALAANAGVAPEEADATPAVPRRGRRK